MSGYVLASLVGAAAAILGGLLTGRQHANAQAAQRADERRNELKVAMVEYLAALDAATVQQSQHPSAPPKRTVDQATEKVLRWLGLEGVLELFARALGRRIYGERPDALTDRLLYAAAHLRLIAPPEVAALMQEVQTTARNTAPADRADSAEWAAVRERVRAGFRGCLDARDAPSTRRGIRRMRAPRSSL